MAKKGIGSKSSISHHIHHEFSPILTSVIIFIGVVIAVVIVKFAFTGTTVGRGAFVGECCPCPGGSGSPYASGPVPPDGSGSSGSNYCQEGENICIKNPAGVPISQMQCLHPYCGEDVNGPCRGLPMCDDYKSERGITTEELCDQGLGGTEITAYGGGGTVVIPACKNPFNPTGPQPAPCGSIGEQCGFSGEVGTCWADTTLGGCMCVGPKGRINNALGC